MTAGRVAGRPRDPAADEAILANAAAVFIECGGDALTIEAVAARAGVGKATIYRRYPSKERLVVAVVARLTEAEIPSPDTGDVGEDLRIIGRGMVRLLTGTDVGPIFVQLVGLRRRNAELAAAYAQFLSERVAVMVAVVRRGVERRQLRVDATPEVVVDLLRGPILARYLIGDPVDHRLVDDLVDAILAAYTPR